MAKKKKKKNRTNRNHKVNSGPKEKKKKIMFFSLPDEIKKKIAVFIVFIVALIFSLSFFNLAGMAGEFIRQTLFYLIGYAIYALPLIFVLIGFSFLNLKYKNLFRPTLLASLVFIIGLSGLVAIFSLETGDFYGGQLGYIFAWPLKKLFGRLVSQIIFGALIIIGGLIFWHLIRGPKPKKDSLEQKQILEKEEKPSLIKKIFLPKFNVKAVEPKNQETSLKAAEPEITAKPKPEPTRIIREDQYKLPPIELLEGDKGKPAAGDTVSNSAIIKKTLENFGIAVEMSEINTGPTVTQYTLKPAEGIKLSKITTLSNNLSLALASHPIRIEAPVPGKALVGIEVPNKVRSQVRLKDLVNSPQFQTAGSNLTLVLGKDVSGISYYADLSRMPHLLVAGSTGTGKTIFLNSLILSLLYQNSPDILRLILVDPKRVEFSAYKDLPHLLTQVIFDPQRAINALRWLISEMEKRFDTLSRNGSRNIHDYNQKIIREKKKPLPYIVLIIDELADLMAAKGREMEAGIVRLAQMARAVGIHLVLATQRPSVEVITGLIKANITSRVTFQVASQVDSRTVIDTAGAERLLGAGDLLFISAEISKPKRIQGAYVSEKEVRKVVDYINAQKEKLLLDDQGGDLSENHLAEDLEKSLEAGPEENISEGFSGDEDPLYQEAKKIVIETRKASASFLQRRLRIGYARAARLLDILEEDGVIGPGEGAKPREVYLNRPTGEPAPAVTETEEEPDEEGWKKV